MGIPSKLFHEIINELYSILCIFVQHIETQTVTMDRKQFVFWKENVCGRRNELASNINVFDNSTWLRYLSRKTYLVIVITSKKQSFLLYLFVNKSNYFLDFYPSSEIANVFQHTRYIPLTRKTLRHNIMYPPIR